jgi:hypothetical protein
MAAGGTSRELSTRKRNIAHNIAPIGGVIKKRCEVTNVTLSFNIFYNFGKIKERRLSDE